MGKIKFNLGISLLLSAFFICGCQKEDDVKAVRGLFDLAGTGFSYEKRSLDGEWEFYWNNLADFAAIDATSDDKKVYVKVPSSWNSLLPEAKSGQGYATYRLKLRLPHYGIRYYFRLPPQTSAYEMYINRKKVSGSGKVGARPDESEAKYQIQYASFIPNSYDSEIIIAVSNYHHARGGFRKSIEFGSKGKIQGQSLMFSAGEVFVFGALLSMGLYQLTVFLLRREEKSSFFFSIFCFLTGTRLLVLDNYYIMYIFPNFSWDLMQRIDYISAPLLVAVYITYVRTLYPLKTDVSDWMVSSSWISSGLFSLFVLLTPATIFTKTNLLSQTFILFYSVCIFYSITKIYIQKRKDSRLIFYGSIFLCVGSLHDLFTGNYWFKSHPVMGFFLFFFFLVQGILLSRRNARIYSSMEKMTEELIEINKRLERSNVAYSKFVPLKFLESLGKSKNIDMKRGDYIVKNMTVLSSDIRDFTAISESLSPQDNFLFLNDYLSRVGPIIRSKDGFIEKYIGDAILAFFEKGPDDAVIAAVELHKAIAFWNQNRKEDRFPKINIGVGIHFGELMLGVIGEEDRIESAVLSDTAGIANTLESMTKKYGAKIILSLDALLETKEPDHYPHRILDFVKVPAKKKLVGIAEILIQGLEESFDAKIQTKDRFEKGVHDFWDGNFEVALDEFNYVLATNSSDIAAKLYKEKAISYIQNGTPPGWEKI
ncbi:adenylate/guanylate cyclase domain-containing protein [Leptospira idonii]|uniref:Adenylate/guanylate cyclase domain-containing protein n=1 Tax=Leptospira idonii TaxID=1193500 RepID=A0A4R9M295_9LEPT|nr:adenylate/guanylate cyclase domain-containing protein [Leptospira idonii]TGN18888.1 adenylate/guanylate cyclase domain-containing protein [Leptospira idonii]